MKQRNIRPYEKPAKKPERNLAVMVNFAIQAIIPVVAFFSSLVLIDEGKKANWLFLLSLKMPYVFPSALIKIPLIGDLFFYLSHVSYNKAIFLFTISFWIFYSSIFTILFVILLKLVGFFSKEKKPRIPPP